MLREKTTKSLINALLIITIIFLLTKISNLLMPVLDIASDLIVPIIIGGFFYYALRPIARFIKTKTKKRGLSAVITILIVVIVITLMFVYGGNIIAKQFKEAFVDNRDKFVEYGNFLNAKFRELFPDFDIVQRAVETLKNSVDNLGSNISSIFSSVGDFGTQVVLVPFVLFYLLKDDNLFEKKFFSSVVPMKYRSIIKNMAIRIDTILTTYINGQIIVALVIATLMFIGYLIIGMPNALLMASFALITSIIPLIGAFLGVLPAILIALTIDVSLAVKVAIVSLIVQQIEGNLVTPNIMGNKLKLHPLAVIFIVIISVNLLGILGAFIGIPLFLIIVTVVKTIIHIVKNKKDKDLSEIKKTQ